MSTIQIILLVVAAIFLLPVIYNLLFPLKPPRLDNYFLPGQIFESKMEGVVQQVLKVENGLVYSELTLQPGAAGPPVHVHLGFDEVGEVVKGEAVAIIDGKLSTVRAGEKLVIPKGLYHNFYSESPEPMIARSEGVPINFAYTLCQFYPLMDKPRVSTLDFLMKLAVLDDLADTWIQGPPVSVQKALRKIMKPYARLLGYSRYDERSKP